MQVQHEGDDRDAGRELSGSLRRCIVTRAERTPDDLIRFVVGPDGALVPDLARRLPGRGVWVTATKPDVERAVATSAFTKSLKRQVNVPPDLAQSVETLLIRRTLEALSLANKAGLVATGFDKVEKLIKSMKADTLVHGADAAQDGCRKLDGKFEAICAESGGSGAVVDWLTIDQLSLAIGRPNVVHAGLKRGGATMRFVSEAGRLRRYRAGFGTP